MTLAIFDLDNTLLDGDSDYLWGEFLVEQGVVDGEAYRRENDRFFQQYKDGTLDIHEFLRFGLYPLTQHAPDTLRAWHAAFMSEKIEPIMQAKARELLAEHRAAGRTLMIITATNSFITAPIGEAFGVDALIATDPRIRDGVYTGEVEGTPCFREGKVERLQTWLAEHGESLDGSWFYSDSHNDLPLLEAVSHPVAVDPDETLAATARERGWEIISLRAG